MSARPSSAMPPSPPRGSGRTIVTLLLVLCAIGGLGWWGFGSRHSAKPKSHQTPLPIPASTSKPATEAASDEKIEPKSNVGQIQLPKSDQAEGKGDRP